MKRIMVVFLAVVFLAFAFSGVMAASQGAHDHGSTTKTEASSTHKGSAMHGSMSDEDAKKHAQFMKDTLSLRQKMMQLHTEVMTLKTQTTPDWKAIADKKKEIVDVKVELMKKANEAGIKHGMGKYGMHGECDGKGMMGHGKRDMGKMKKGMDKKDTDKKDTDKKGM